MTVTKASSAEEKQVTGGNAHQRYEGALPLLILPVSLLFNGKSIEEVR